MQRLCLSVCRVYRRRRCRRFENLACPISSERRRYCWLNATSRYTSSSLRPHRQQKFVCLRQCMVWVWAWNRTAANSSAARRKCLCFLHFAHHRRHRKNDFGDCLSFEYVLCVCLSVDVDVCNMRVRARYHIRFEKSKRKPSNQSDTHPYT